MTLKPRNSIASSHHPWNIALGLQYVATGNSSLVTGQLSHQVAFHIIALA